MTITKRYEAMGSTINVKPPEVKVIRSYEPKAEVAATSVDDNKVAQSLATDVAPTVDQRISFEKPTQTEEVAEGAAPAEVVDEKAKKRQERADSFKRAAEMERKAQAAQKEAQAMMAQAKHFQELIVQAKQDPTLVAKAMGMSTEEFLRAYQNKVLSIDDAPQVKPEEEVKQRLAQYEQERQQEKQRMAQLESQTIRQSYISSKILPVIISDVEKFQLLNMNGKENAAGFIYDMMDAHYRKTGEELSVTEIAEEMETQLTQEIENKINEMSKVKKFSNRFVRTEADGHLGAGPARGEVNTSRSKTLSDSYGTSAPMPSFSSAPLGAKKGTREERLARVMKKFGG